MPRYTVYIDGGCLNNQNASLRKAYGTYRVECENKVVDFNTAMYGRKTNNQAEYLILIDVLEWLISQEKTDGIDIFTDSQLVFQQLAGGYAVRNTNIKKLYERSKELLDKFTNISVNKISRSIIEEKVGH